MEYLPRGACSVAPLIPIGESSVEDFLIVPSVCRMHDIPQRMEKKKIILLKMLKWVGNLPSWKLSSLARVLIIIFLYLESPSFSWRVVSCLWKDLRGHYFIVAYSSSVENACRTDKSTGNPKPELPSDYMQGIAILKTSYEQGSFEFPDAVVHF